MKETTYREATQITASFGFQWGAIRSVTLVNSGLHGGAGVARNGYVVVYGQGQSATSDSYFLFVNSSFGSFSTPLQGATGMPLLNLVVDSPPSLTKQEALYILAAKLLGSTQVGIYAAANPLSQDTSGWIHATNTPPGIETDRGPAITSDGNVVYMVYKGLNDPSHLYINYARNPLQQSSWQKQSIVVHEDAITDSQPSVAIGLGAIVIAYLDPTTGGVMVTYGQSATAGAFSAPEAVTTRPIIAPPTITVVDNGLASDELSGFFISYVDPVGTIHMLYSPGYQTVGSHSQQVFQPWQKLSPLMASYGGAVSPGMMAYPEQEDPNDPTVLGPHTLYQTRQSNGAINGFGLIQTRLRASLAEAEETDDAEATG